MHFPNLSDLRLTGNHVKAEAMTCLSTLTALRCVTVGFQDLDECDCDILGIQDMQKHNIIEGRMYYSTTAVLPGVMLIIES